MDVRVDAGMIGVYGDLDVKAESGQEQSGGLFVPA
jgi:hypothetical protein